MTNYLEDPTVDLRKWLWAELQLANIMSATDYLLGSASVNPVIPLQQQPEFVDRFKDKPFIVYDIVTEPVDTDMFYISCEQVLFTVFCGDFDTSKKIRNLMIDLFRRQELSAIDLNNFSPSPISYLSISVIENRWAKPERSEGGRMAFDMIIRVEYVKQIESNGRLS